MIDAKESTESEMANKRSAWIDILRALLIITVVIGHSNVDTRMIQIIFWFHMPLFFCAERIFTACAAERRMENVGHKKSNQTPYSLFVFLYFMCTGRWKFKFQQFCMFCDGRKTTGGCLLVCYSFISG